MNSKFKTKPKPWFTMRNPAFVIPVVIVVVVFATMIMSMSTSPPADADYMEIETIGSP